MIFAVREAELPGAKARRSVNGSGECFRIWCLARDQYEHIKPVEESWSGRAQFHYDTSWDPGRLKEAKPDLVLCVNDYPFEVAQCLDRARQNAIPSLVLQDGILEWRCQYENPLFGMGGGAPQHQPVLADKIAGIGRASARHLAAWGNASRVEVTGMPRLDHLRSRKFASPRRPGNRLLVMSAKNPGFTAKQREVTLQSLRDLTRHLQTRLEVQTTWRISRSLAEAIGISQPAQPGPGASLVEALEASDAVITTPSTVMLEAMLLGRPVASLDYHCAPAFQATAWTINAPEQMAGVISELLQAPASKMCFQEVCLADGLEGGRPASERVCVLMERMILNARRGKLGANLLGAGDGFQVAPRPPLATLYPGSAVFGDAAVEDVQLRLARAQNENERLRAENRCLRTRWTPGRWVQGKVLGLFRGRFPALGKTRCTNATKGG
jgi:hypothetical protein